MGVPGLWARQFRKALVVLGPGWGMAVPSIPGTLDSQCPGWVAGCSPWGPARPGLELMAQSLHICAGKCFLFMSELQLVKFYSDRKLVTSLSNYKSLEGAHPVKPSGLWDLWLEMSSGHLFQHTGWAILRASGLGMPQEPRDPIRIRAPCHDPPQKSSEGMVNRAGASWIMPCFLRP